MKYADFSEGVTGNKPFPYQVRLREQPWPDLINVPTGLGQTAAIAVAWLWKTRCRDASSPRRLLGWPPAHVLEEEMPETKL